MYVLVLRSREPISYGEESVGIKTLIKRISILLPEQGEVLQVPVILGNGLRGVLRDTMTNVFLEKVAEIAKKNNKNVDVDARVLLLMLTGGVLRRRGEEQVTAKSIDNLRQKTGVLLPLNIMGFALSNVMIPSKIKVSVFYPVCSETFALVKDLIDQVKDETDIDFDKLSTVSIRNLIDEVQMMHKDDVSKLTNISLPGIKITNIGQADTIRGRQVQETRGEEESESQQGQQEERVRARLQAIFQREYVVPGTVFIGFISEIVPLSDAERELLALSVRKLKGSGGVGGAVARGFGSFSIEYNDLDKLIPSGNSSKLDSFIESNLDKILEVLKSNPEEWLRSS
ncbi:RAMP superfamily CRISPR-associated protein [Pyrodictium delaneyi]|uniref:CRISPR type III-associated protein domain-containing protein n=1 Tax=Pyrodictium delaneyi TaxID=1273541 RepID=A0A211YNW5_9CREN|nr:RAMP superfamily CRISPR-associated protein [Pyrodictium delaneyi]OWJ54733.1 hypothetical protein Pdsh_03115 [Pyrodictium delaneyi]